MQIIVVFLNCLAVFVMAKLMLIIWYNKIKYLLKNSHIFINKIITKIVIYLKP